MEKKTVKPATAGALVRLPGTYQPLPDEGQQVEWNSYWERRLRDGDVVVVEPGKKEGK